MPMLAWYKLNGDLLDSSGNGNHLGGTHSSYVDGQVGKAASFSGQVYQCVDDYRKLFLPINFTITVRVKPTNNSKLKGIINFGYGISLHIDGNGNINSYFTNKGTSVNSGTSFLPNDLFNGDYHNICLSYDCTSKMLSLYYDGIFRSSITREFNGDTGYYNGVTIGNEADNPDTYFVGDMQDLRIYDHCLSDKEIYDLSKALVLKYDFDDVEEPTVNLLNTMSIAENIGLVSNTYNSIDDTRRLITSGDTTSPGHVGSRTLLPIEYNNYYTLSYEYIHNDGKDTLSDIGIGVHWTGGNAGFTKKYKLADGWIKVELTVYVDSSLGYTNVNSGISVCCSSSIDITVRKFQAEKKDHATPFVNGTRDQIVVRDKSDYGNDSLPLTVANTPTFVEDCKIGRLSSKMVDYKYLQINKTNLCLLNKCSISFWRKRTRTGNWLPINSANPGGNYIMATSEGTGNFYHQGVGSGSIIYKNGEVSLTPANDDNWNHYVITGLDLSSWSNIFFNLYDQNGEWTNACIFDDIRIYATALTAEDVKEIYQSRANLDDRGNLKVVTLKEKNNIAFLVDEGIKKGNLNNGNLYLYKAQPNCVTSFIDGMIRIYRPPNINNSQWGGFYIRIPEFTLKTGKSYSLKFDYKGKASRGISTIYASYRPDHWRVGGLDLVRATSSKEGVQSRFDTDTWRTAEMIFNVTSSNLYMTATRTENGVVSGNSYYIFSWIKIGFGYEATGDLGADVYIRNVKFYENEENLTYEKNFSIKENGDLLVKNVSELGVTEGLIAHYPLNGDAKDYSGNGNDGTVVGATVAAGLGQKCYYFAKSIDERIIIPTNPIFDTKHLSIQLWVKPNDVSSTLENNFLCKERQYQVRFLSGELYFAVETIDPAVLFWVNTGVRVNENEWINFYFKYNAISFDVYKNGVFAVSIPHNKGELVSGTGSLQLGNRESHPRSSINGFKGSLQDVRIYNRPLTPEEVLINYNLTKADKTAMIQSENGTTYVGQIKED